MNTFKVAIMNYQRIKKAKLEFVPGLNVIVGHTNAGKSAVVRSIETAIFNIPREGHITLGETRSAVGINYGGHEVIWRRDVNASSQVSYRVDGKIYAKLGRGQPDIVRNALNISEVSINDRKYRLNFAKQMAYPFLLDATPSELFKFIVQSSEEDNVVDVLDTMKKDMNQMVSNVKSYEESRDELGKAFQREYEKFKAKKQYVKTCDEVIALDSDVKKFSKFDESISVYGQCQYVVDTCSESLKSVKKINSKLSDEIEKLDSLVESYEHIQDLLFEYSQVESGRDGCIAKLSELNNELERSSGYEDVLSEFNENVMNERGRVFSNSVESYWKMYLESLRDKESLKEYKGSVEDLESIEGSIGQLLSKSEDLQSKLAILESWFDQYEDLQVVVGSANTEINDYKKVIEESSSQLNEIGVCPYCGAPITEEHLNNVG